MSIVTKSKKLYYSNLDEKNVRDKIVSREKSTLIETDEIVESHINGAQILSNFFSNIVSNLKTAECVNWDPISDNINDPVIKSIVKYRNYPSILKIGDV